MKNKSKLVKILHWLFACWSCCGAISAQPESEKILFTNPSFDGKAGAGQIPRGWVSVLPGNTPDIFPGAWNLNFAPQHGSTCLGLVTREDGSTEEISQSLHQVLKKGTCYTFSIFLSHAEQYVGYNLPVRLKIWGGAKYGEKSELLASSVLVNHTDWREYKFQFLPLKDIRFLTFQVYFAPGVNFFYKGNLLLDNCSPIIRCDRA